MRANTIRLTVRINLGFCLIFTNVSCKEPTLQDAAFDNGRKYTDHFPACTDHVVDGGAGFDAGSPCETEAETDTGFSAERLKPELWLWPNSGVYIRRKDFKPNDDIPFGVQGTWYTFTDQEYEKEANDADTSSDSEDKTEDRSNFTINPLDKMASKNDDDDITENNGTEIINAEGDVWSERWKEDNDPRKRGYWGAGFGFELCFVRPKDTRPKDYNSEIPFATEYTYPLQHCPFIKEHRRFRGIEFVLTDRKEKNPDARFEQLAYGKLEVHFKQLGESDSSRAKCFIYQDEKYEDPDGNEIKCIYDEEEKNPRRVTVLVDDVGADVDKITAVHFQVDSSDADVSAENGTAERHFSFSIENLEAILEKDNIEKTEIPNTDDPYLSRNQCPGLETCLAVDAGDAGDSSCTEAAPKVINDIDWIEITNKYCNEIDVKDDDGDGDTDPEEIESERIPSQFCIMKTEANVEQLYEFYKSREWPWEKTQDKIRSLTGWGVCALHTYVQKNMSDEYDLNKRSVNCVDYCTAARFCEWIGGRLPYEDEWMCAAMAGGGNKYDDDAIGVEDYPWGDSDPNCDLAIISKGNGGYECGDRFYHQPRVGCSTPDNNGDTKDGVCDMGGNVFEWTSSVYRDASGIANDKGFMAIKGGSLYSETEKMLKINSRSMEHSYEPYSWGRMGFRCVKDSPCHQTENEKDK